MPRKKAKTKDWYWECEPAEVLADEDLANVPSPDGWLDEGLSCVGLYWLMLCVMHRSPRRGYLLDVNSLPLKTDSLARILRRSVGVVEKVQAVLISSGLFSVDKHGVPYSRGMVRREEIKRKRRKSGSLGGLASKRLLKQTVEQMVEQKEQQMLGMGIGVSAPSSSLLEGDFAQAKFAEAAERVAFLYRSTLRGRRPEEVTICVQAFVEMLAMGVSEETLTTDLKRGPPGRDRSEQLWQIKKRLLEGNGHGHKTSLTEAAGDMFEWAKQRDANDKP